MSSPIDERFEQLAAGYFDQTLTDAELDRFLRMLREDDACMRRFAELAQLDQMIGREVVDRQRQILVARAIDPDDSSDTRVAGVLAELARVEAAAEAEPVVLTPPQHQPTRARRQEPVLSPREIVSVTGYLLGRALRTRPALYAYAASAVLLAAIWLIPWGGAPDSQTAEQPSPDTPPQAAPVAVATLTDTHDAQWSAFKLSAGDTLYAKQRLTLTAGFAEITTARGAVALLEAPTTIELTDSDNAIRLHTGKLVGICETASSKGFLVRTPHMDVIDLGTRFGVDASQPYRSEVHVFEGEVAVVAAGAEDADDSMRLSAGTSASASGRDDTVSLIDHATDRFAALMPRTVQLPATGAGLSIGQIDPAWSIVAIDGRKLDTPIRPAVFTDEFHIPDASTPGGAQWLAWVTRGEAARKDATYLFQTRLSLPGDPDPDAVRIALRYAADNHLLAIIVNGQRLPISEHANSYDMRLYHLDRHLVPGENVIGFEILNIGRRVGENPVGLQVAWEVRSDLRTPFETDQQRP